jgi:galactokinase
MTINELKSAFVYAYQQNAAAVYFVPGKIYLIGEHIANFEKVDMYPALSAGIYLLLRKNNEQSIKFWSLNEPESVNLDINIPMRRTINSWIKYPLIVFNQLIDNGVKLKNGYDMLFWGNMPIGATLTPTEGLELITTFAMKD